MGGRSVTSQTSPREAAMDGADGVIAIDLEYSEIATRGSGGILFAAAMGAAVSLKPFEA